MKKSAIVFALVSLLGLASQSAFAQLTCTSAWTTDEETPHCHVVVSQVNDTDGHFICTAGLNLPSVSTAEACGALCENNEGRQGRVESLLLADLSHKSMAIKSLLSDLIKAKTQAAMACLKADLLGALIQSASQASGDHSDLE